MSKEWSLASTKHWECVRRSLLQQTPFPLRRHAHRIFIISCKIEPLSSYSTVGCTPKTHYLQPKSTRLRSGDRGGHIIAKYVPMSQSGPQSSHFSALTNELPRRKTSLDRRFLNTFLSFPQSLTPTFGRCIFCSGANVLICLEFRRLQIIFRGRSEFAGFRDGTR